jgi:flagellin
LIADSTGAEITTSGQSTKTWDFRDVEDAVEVRNTLRIGVVLNPTSDEGRDKAILEPVLISFTATDPIRAASQIQGAIENQLGGEYRAGGDLHIDVRAVAEVRKANAADANATNGDALIGREVELTDSLFTTSRNHFGPTNVATFANLAGGALVLSEEVADIQNVRFKFTTTTTAGVNETPQIRAISETLAGYENAGKLFENLNVATGEHGNDKFLINIDGEVIEADLDVAAATNGANAIVDKVVGVEETARVVANAQAGMRLSRIGFNTSAGGVVSNATGAASATSGATSVSANNLTYAVDSDAGAADYFDPEALRLLVQDGINKQSVFSKDVGVAYDSVTRTFSTTTGTRGNQSSLTIGKSVAPNRSSTLMPELTALVNSTGGSGIKGALGFNKDAFSNGSGSIFEFRLGGEKDTYSITIDTLGAQNFGADLKDISNVNVGTQGGAAAAISLLQDALESVSTTQTKIGAGINHMQRRINVLETHREALSGQRARIQEIDFTQETRTLASLQILLQSSTAALAQANIIPQTLLQLLA